MYKQLVILHTNVEMKFAAYIQHAVAASILSLMHRAGQSPKHIEFAPDEHLSEWLDGSCPLIIKGANQVILRDLDRAARENKLPAELLYCSLGQGRGKAESLLVIGPCDDKTIQWLESLYPLSDITTNLEFFDDND